MLSNGTYVADRVIDFPLNIVGGLTPGADWQRIDDEHRSIIEYGGAGDGGITTTLFIDLDGEFFVPDVELAYLDIHPPPTPEPVDLEDWDTTAASVATLRVENVHEGTVFVRDSIIEGGVAGDGLSGSNGAVADQPNSVHGQAGIAANMNSGFTSIHVGGEGGQSACAGDGGDGGDAPGCGYGSISDDRNPRPGDDGADFSDALGGSGGDGADPNIGGYICDGQEHHKSADSGGHGTVGGSGAAGDGGTTLAGLEDDEKAGTFNASGHWSTPLIGTPGDDGQPGAGGGGGGAGTSDNLGTNDEPVGASGGGGGAGGCGGLGGQAGPSGGASIAIVVANADVNFVDDSLIHIGIGGNGGEGGDGSCGAPGGHGGHGGSTHNTAGELGEGGCGAMGGYGGIGGGGAGGYGGPALGIATIDDASVDGDYIIDDSDASPGIGGDGGGAPEPTECFQDFHADGAGDNSDDSDAINCPGQTFANLETISPANSGEPGPDGALIELHHFLSPEE